MLALRRSGDRVRFSVRVTPRASSATVGGRDLPGQLLARDRAGIDGRAQGVQENSLVRVTGPPAGGKANDAVIRAVARALGLAPADVELVRGATARTKVLSVPRRAETALLRLASGSG